MRHIKVPCLLLLVIAASGLTVTYAQTIFRARAEGSYRRGVMFRLTKMSDPESVAVCDRVVLVGTVESAARNDKDEIISFSLKTRTGGQRTVNLSSALYPQLPIEAERGLAKLLSEGKKVRIVAYSCQGGMPEADEIRAL